MKKTEYGIHRTDRAAPPGWLALFLCAGLLFAACAAPPVPPPEKPVAPVPVRPPGPEDVSDCRLCHAGSRDYPLAADVYRSWESSGHGRFLDRPEHRPDCAACHDLAGTAAAGHLDGTVDVPGPNPFHLVEGYLPSDPRREWDLQVHFDDYCWTSCHQPAGIRDMRHEQDGDPAPGAVQMGQHLSFESVHGGLPVDEDLARIGKGFAGPPYFVPCVGCHDPHGTGTTSTTKGSNRMVRENYKQPARLCGRCHA